MTWYYTQLQLLPTREINLGRWCWCHEGVAPSGGCSSTCRHGNRSHSNWDLWAQDLHKSYSKFFFLNRRLFAWNTISTSQNINQNMMFVCISSSINTLIFLSHNWWDIHFHFIHKGKDRRANLHSCFPLVVPAINRCTGSRGFPKAELTKLTPR